MKKFKFGKWFLVWFVSAIIFSTVLAATITSSNIRTTPAQDGDVITADAWNELVSKASPCINEWEWSCWLKTKNNLDQLRECKYWWDSANNQCTEAWQCASISYVSTYYTNSESLCTQWDPSALTDNGTTYTWLCGSTSCSANNLEYWLIAYYPFDWNANDVEWWYNGSLVWNTSLTTDKAGNSDSAYDFDGDWDFIQVADANVLDFTNWFTAIAMINANTAWWGNYGRIISKFNGTNGWREFWLWDGMWDKLFLKINNVNLWSENGTVVWGWHHVVGIYNPWVGWSFYVDWVAAGTSNADTNPIWTLDGVPMKIGSWYNTNRDFNGKIDEVRLYNRILSLAEIQALNNLTQ